MRRILFPVFALSLVASPLLAQPRASRDLTAFPAPELRGVVSTDPRVKEALESRPLFFAPPADSLDGARTLAFRINLNGRPYLEETLRVERLGAGAFELLAMRPELLDRLYTISANRADRVTVEVLVDGRPVHAFSSFEELVQYNRELKATSLNPLVAKSEVRDYTGAAKPPAVSTAKPKPATAKGMQADPYCADQCYGDYDRCTDYGWGCDYGDCSRCQNSLDACLSYCPIVCVDPKNSTIVNNDAVVATNYGGQECREHQWESDFTSGEWYTNTRLTWKRTKVRRTEYCDGHVEQEVLSYEYWYVYCWTRTYMQCTSPVTWAQPAC
jgi:hypothetical protein